MEFFEICKFALQREQEKFRVDLKSRPSAVKNLDVGDSDFHSPYDRLAYIYKHGTIDFHFLQECLAVLFQTNPPAAFLSDPSVKRQFVDRTPNLRLCSLTSGPALDYLALVLAFSRWLGRAPAFESVDVLSPSSGVWKHTASFVFEALASLASSSSAALGENVKFAGAHFRSPIQDKRAISKISNADSVLMCRSLKSIAKGTGAQEALLVLLEVLKPESLLFFVDDESAATLVTNTLQGYPGRFVFRPVVVDVILSGSFPFVYKFIYSCYPLTKASGVFFVWRKSPTPLLSFKPRANIEDSMDDDGEAVITEIASIEHPKDALSVQLVPQAGTDGSSSPYSVEYPQEPPDQGGALALCATADDAKFGCDLPPGLVCYLTGLRDQLDQVIAPFADPVEAGSNGLDDRQMMSLRESHLRGGVGPQSVVRSNSCVNSKLADRIDSCVKGGQMISKSSIKAAIQNLGQACEQLCVMLEESE